MLCSDIHSALEPLLTGIDARQIVVIRDSHVPFESSYPTLVLSLDERDKTIGTVEQIWDFLFAQQLTRSGLVIAVGGGVLTDLAGFAAATYKRGIRYINIPTTLLAMIDASSGGKTGFNYRGLKNSIGAFHMPIETIVCPSFLHTLPAEQMLSGFAEMLKTALLSDTDLWHGMMQYDLDTMPVDTLAPLIAACMEVKQRIVDADPHEQGPRKTLNLGHTFGHALEELSMTAEGSNSASGLLHGYAVLYGLIAELYLSVTRLGCPKEPLQQLTQLMLHYYGRPQCNCKHREQLIALMQQDKKNERTAQINCTLIRSIGSPVINQLISPDTAIEAWDYLFSL